MENMESSENFEKNGKSCYECTYCSKIYSTQGNLTKHQKISKSCINNRADHICEYCGKKLSSIYTLERHYDTCKNLNITEKYKKEVNTLKEINKNTEIKYLILDDKYNALIEKYKKLEEKYDEVQNELKQTYKNMQEFLIKNPKVINTTNNNYTTQNSTNNLTVKQYVSQLQPITAIDFQNTLQHYTDKYIDEGAIGYAKFLLDHPCNNKIVTTDLSRKIIAYRTDKNEFIKDPKCRELIKMAIVDHKQDILTICTKRRKLLGDMKTLDDDSYMNDVYTKKINDITEFIIFLKNDLEDYVETNVPNKISSEITNRTQQYTNVKTNVMELE